MFAFVHVPWMRDATDACAAGVAFPELTVVTEAGAGSLVASLRHPAVRRAMAARVTAAAVRANRMGVGEVIMASFSRTGLAQAFSG